MKVNSRAKFEKYPLFKPLSQNIEILTPREDDISSKMGQKGHIGLSCNNIDRWKVLSSELFMYKTFLSKFWSFNLMCWRHQPKVGSKAGPNSYVIKRWISKIKWTLRWGIRL